MLDEEALYDAVIDVLLDYVDDQATVAEIAGRILSIVVGETNDDDLDDDA